MSKQNPSTDNTIELVITPTNQTCPLNETYICGITGTDTCPSTGTENCPSC
jgi:hypothetical protein